MIVLTAQSELDERVEAFKLGAIDFVRSHFSFASSLPASTRA